MPVRQTLLYERELSAVEKIDLLDELEKRDATIATLTAEVTRLTEALRVSEAQRVLEAPLAANEELPSEGGSAELASTGAGAKKRDEKPEKPPQTVDEARHPSTLRRFKEPGFADRHTLLVGASQGAHDMRVRRMLKAMDAVRLLRVSDGEADTEAVVDALDKIAAPGIGAFCDALTVLKEGTGLTFSKEAGKGVKGLGKTEAPKLRVACALVAHGLRPKEWVAALFPDTWEEQMPKTLADMANESAARKRPPTKVPSKRKKTA
ncbi:unnamed protein product [Closterium sp. Naga37s-1]|nr:unnamed protein product [Closterium sp. Naga37s-1]